MYTSHNRVKHEENKVNVEPKVLFFCQLIYSAILNLLPVLPRCAYHFICHDDGHEHILYMWQSRVEIEHYSVAYFHRFTAFEAL